MDQRQSGDWISVVNCRLCLRIVFVFKYTVNLLLEIICDNYVFAMFMINAGALNYTHDCVL